MPGRVAVVGGGISGLVCAARLGQLGVSDVTVFDTGRHACGGRCSSRTETINGSDYVFDHSAQYFTVSDPRFAPIVSSLHSKGAVRIWSGPVGHLKDGKFTADPSLTQAFVGTGGMRSVAECLSTMCSVQRPGWVGSVAFDSVAKKWKVDKYGFFDYLVIAHNGKCADRLMSDSGAAVIHQLLRVRFSHSLNPRDARMHLTSLWVLMVAFKSSLNLPFEGAHVTDVAEAVSWICNNSKKLRQSGPVECWTVVSTAAFGSAHKVPQENVPPGKRKEVVQALLASLSRVTGVKNLPEVCFTRVQLWGAALPLNVYSSRDECLFDAQRQVGVCGDWLVSPCIQGAALSGLAMAEKIRQHVSGDAQSSTLQPQFKAALSEAVGAFPVNPKMIFSPKKQ
ncbi:LOW QUALITY PROTEIN: renalase-like [Babylonia areolata]|uniref:LOW QUALITY PROTEIN: renalase-like n=1 Tax=Babylonia areolata TaxID=304850 RepID=UPI003FD587E3